MEIYVKLKDEFGLFFKNDNVQRYEFDTKIGFLKIYYDGGSLIYIKLREIEFVKIYKK